MKRDVPKVLPMLYVVIAEDKVITAELSSYDLAHAQALQACRDYGEGTAVTIMQAVTRVSTCYEEIVTDTPFGI